MRHLDTLMVSLRASTRASPPGRSPRRTRPALERMFFTQRQRTMADYGMLWTLDANLGKAGPVKIRPAH